MKRVVIAEDDEEVRILMVFILSHLGEDFNIEVESHDNGSSALDSLINNAPDLAILDYRMPDLNGLEVTYGVRLQGLHFPILIVSGIPLAGFDNNTYHLTKPFNIQELRELIKSLFKEGVA